MRGAVDGGLASAPEDLANKKSIRDIKQKPVDSLKQQGSIPYDTTDESEDFFHDQLALKPRLRPYNKDKDGGLLYAFIELTMCPKPVERLPIEFAKSGSCNPWNTNAEVYKNSIVSTSLTGFGRQSSEKFAQKKTIASSLSTEEYQRVLELKSQRMKTLLQHQ
eukprot:CAMPEP_0197012426 /NCGR_PEP_ID=MMETSP1380-20130617/62383_1 /TAXON_ID=5936 /ORGANISM="Euplotes crassus, Strain CT5" /LENGTH=162 /DNA_ID=CAMNT_0042435871 /DNA_START=769 /DNA_END=1257 /DNA_ORIENTATION=+